MKQSRTATNNKARRSKKRNFIKDFFARIGAFLSYIFGGGAAVVGENYRNGIKGMDIIKYALYSIAGLLLILLQTTFFTRFRLFDTTPDILIIAVTAVAMYENEKAGAVFGLLVGFTAEAAGSHGMTLLPLIYMLTGYICGIVASDYYRRSVLLFFIFDLGAVILRTVTTLLYIVFSWSTMALNDAFLHVLVPEFFSTLLMSPVPVLLLLPIYGIFHRKESDKPGLD